MGVKVFRVYGWMGSILNISFFIIILLTGFLFSCNRSGKSSSGQETENQQPGTSQKSDRILSARTLGLAYLEEGNLDSAEVEFKKLIELAPDEALGYANLGIVFMRQGNLDEAEKQLKKALEMNPDDPDIRLNLAKIYDLKNEENKSREEMEKSLESSPEHLKTLYGLAESYQKHSDKNSIVQWESYLKKIVKTAPGNIVARLHLAEAQISNGETDDALANLTEIGKQSPSFPDEAVKYYDTAIKDLKEKDAKGAVTAVRVLHNLLKLTNFYQTALSELKGSSGTSTVGNPVISFSHSRAGFMPDGESILNSIQFTDATQSAGLEVAPDTLLAKDLSDFPATQMALGDMDRDGDVDIYLGTWNSKSGRYENLLLQNDHGRYKNITAESGIKPDATESCSAFADYNNDGFLDLYIQKDGPNRLYDNVSEGKFSDVTAKSGTGVAEDGHKFLFFDMDQDGDLDLFLAGKGPARMFRNNGDGTFSDVTPETNLGSAAGILDVEMGDFNDDGVVDLFMIDEAGQNLLYTNVRQGKFLDVTSQSGLANSGGNLSAAVADYNNDGYADIFTASEGNSSCHFYRNEGDGTFSTDSAAGNVIRELKGVSGYSALFFDFDNDGMQDLIVAGKPSGTNAKGVQLFHNNGKGQFENSSDLLPEDLNSGRQVGVADYNEDGDLDIFITGLYGGIRLLRNDGGNINHQLRVQLVGLRTGSSKNNYFGIGSKIEVRAGNLYQMKTITEPTVYFGLGSRDKADVVRVLWTNGVSQNIFSPGSDKDLVEQQELKGSCPFLYTWNGSKFVFQKDILWRSALGMPLGIMGGTTAYAFADASDDYVKIPGDQLRPDNGYYNLRITAELWETIYFDKVSLVAVDHPDSADIVINEKFMAPPYEPLKIYRVTNKHLPVMARDSDGNNLLDLVSEKDNRYVSDFMPGKFQGTTSIHDLILDPGKVHTGDSLLLFLNGWIFPTDASINYAISQSGAFKVMPPCLQVKDRRGNWKTVIDNIGFPMGKNKTVIVDLTGKFLSANHEVRIRTNMEIYWDYVYFSSDAGRVPVRSVTLTPAEGDLHYRGFSAAFRKGGQYGPHWFDYSRVSNGPKWRDLTGNYTRFGDITGLLQEPDNEYVIMNAGDEMSVKFKSTGLPDLPAGWTRDFLIHSNGWVKDGDLNTATGNKVDPLPFHGMKAYPYSDGNLYPSDKKLRDYIKQYNTRVITDDNFRNAVRKPGNN